MFPRTLYIFLGCHNPVIGRSVRFCLGCQSIGASEGSLVHGFIKLLLLVRYLNMCAGLLNRSGDMNVQRSPLKEIPSLFRSATNGSHSCISEACLPLLEDHQILRVINLELLGVGKLRGETYIPRRGSGRSIGSVVQRRGQLQTRSASISIRMGIVKNSLRRCSGLFFSRHF